MTAAQVLRSLHLKPFQPFFIHLADSRSLRIGHPEMLLLTGGGRIAVVEDDEAFAESIDVLMIVSLRASNDRY
jgi:hypothetical protein